MDEFKFYYIKASRFYSYMKSHPSKWETLSNGNAKAKHKIHGWGTVQNVEMDPTPKVQLIFENESDNTTRYFSTDNFSQFFNAVRVKKPLFDAINKETLSEYDEKEKTNPFETARKIEAKASCQGQKQLSELEHKFEEQHRRAQEAAAGKNLPLTEPQKVTLSREGKIFCPYCDQPYEKNGLGKHISAAHPEDFNRWQAEGRRCNIYRLIKHNPLICPYCKTEHTLRSASKHCRKKHPDKPIPEHFPKVKNLKEYRRKSISLNTLAEKKCKQDQLTQQKIPYTRKSKRRDWVEGSTVHTGSNKTYGRGHNR